MSQAKKKRTISKSVEKAPGLEATDRDRRGRWTAVIIASVVIAVILSIVGVFYYQENVAPFRRTIITVDDTSIDLGYFIKRARLSGASSFTMLSVLTDEQIIKLEAPRYVGEISPEEIDQGLRIIASQGSGNITDSEFKEWYRQQLNETKFSDSEFREIVATSLLAARLHEYLAERISTVAEQIHLHAILLEMYEDAEKVRARWEAGEDFADLAREVSLDEQTREEGGDIGWFPRGVLDYGLEYTAFNLSTDNVSVPIPFGVSVPSPDPTQSSVTQTVYYLLMVSEEAEAREMDEDSLLVLQAGILDEWLSQETAFHEVEYNFNSEITAWIEWQLTKQ